MIFSGGLLLRFFPFTVFLDQFPELIDSMFKGNMAFNQLLALIQVDSAFPGTDISLIDFAHFTRTVHNAAHHSYF